MLLFARWRTQTDDAVVISGWSPTSVVIVGQQIQRPVSRFENRSDPSVPPVQNRLNGHILHVYSQHLLPPQVSQQQPSLPLPLCDKRHARWRPGLGAALYERSLQLPSTSCSLDQRPAVVSPRYDPVQLVMSRLPVLGTVQLSGLRMPGQSLWVAMAQTVNRGTRERIVPQRKSTVQPVNRL